MKQLVIGDRADHGGGDQIDPLLSLDQFFR
jgi:hypothetical protein